jgi:hypothetical protein
VSQTSNFRGRLVQHIKVGRRERIRVANEVIVQLQPGLAGLAGIVDRVLKELPRNSRLEQAFDPSGLGLVVLPKTADLDAVVKHLSGQSFVAFAEPHYIDTL